MINNVVLTGRLAEIPELRYTPNNKAVSHFTIAVDRPYRKDIEKQADFIRIITWGATAEFTCKYFSKGQKIAIIGSIRTNSYTDKNTGEKKYTFDVVADKVDFVESKSKSNNSNESINSVNNESNDYEPVQQQFENVPYSDNDLPF